MKKKRNSLLSRENLIIFIIALLAIFIGIKVYKGIISHKNQVKIENEIKNSIEIVDGLAKQDINEIQSKLKKLNQKDKIAEIVSDTGEKNYKAFFKNTVFMGDSISEGFKEFDIINKYNVLADKGETVIKAKESLGVIGSINPENVVMLFGMNDVSYYDAPEDGRGVEKFKEDYIDLINAVKKRLPKVNIYIQSPLPVMDKASKSDPMITNENLDKIREQAKAAAVATASNYIDIASIASGLDELHEGDGIHYKYGFYPIWLNYLMEYVK